MKKSIFIVAALWMATGMMFAQRASYVEYVSLDPGEYFDLSEFKWNSQNLYKVQETRIASSYAPKLATIIKGEAPQSNPDGTVAAMLQSGLTGGYNKYFESVAARMYFDNDLIRAMIKKPRVRQLLFNQGCDLLCDLVAMYPKDYKTYLIEELNAQLRSLNEFQVPEGIREGLDEYGRLTLYDNTGEEVENFWLRRIYFDKIPYNELKSMLETLLTRVRAVNVSENDEIMACYRINNQIAYCQSIDDCYFASCTNRISKRLYVNAWGGIAVKYMENDQYQLTYGTNDPPTGSFWAQYGSNNFYGTRIILNSDASVSHMEGTITPRE
jgi:hypothetical protein